jgi:Asp-tRNA(Asn)/Glu-tRNA(Gln) amidotransferase A subunit family amidase
MPPPPRSRGSPSSNAFTIVAAETALARAAKDCAWVAPPFEADAIIVGKANNPEFCYRGVTSNDL